MKFKTIVGLLIVLMVCSCKQQLSKVEEQIDNDPTQELVSKSGLLFERGMNRGTEYTDSLGTIYSLRYAPIIITNDSTIRIHLQLAFSKEYKYPIAYGDETFKVIPLPKEWAQNGTTDSMFDSMFDKLPNYVEKPIINETIEPGEKIAVGIGTLVRKPRNISINLYVPFAHTVGGIFPTCDWQMKENPSSNPEIALGLKLNINEVCTIIPCGQISYPKS